MKFDILIRIGTKLLMPFMLLFALYVQLHGELGPGGGFQAGVIAAGMIILYALVFGIGAAKAIVSQRAVEILVPVGVLIYAGTGVAGLVMGANYLEYSPLGATMQLGQEHGIVAVELGVLITVFSSMTAIFYAFVERGR